MSMISAVSMIPAMSVISATSISMTVAIIFMPMVTVPGFVAVADNNLIVVSTVTGVPVSKFSMTLPGVPFIYHHLVTVIPVKTGISRRQNSCMYPHVIFVIYILVRRDIIIGIDIRHVVIFGVAVADRTPIRLTIYI